MSSSAGGLGEAAMTRNTLLLIRVALAGILGVCLWTAAPSKAATAEYLMVPSGAIGRDILVAAMGGGPHAVCPVRSVFSAFDQ